MNTWSKTILCSFLLAVATVVGAQTTPTSRPDVVEVIEIVGVIDDAMAVNIQQKVENLSENPKIKAVLLVVDSPGGGVLASAAIYDELARIKVPIVGWCNNLCASGGMYVLMAPSVKYIGVRTDVTISGSIGVIAQVIRFNRLLDWAKIDSETYKSGVRKDDGNPTKAAEEEEKKRLQEMIDGLAVKFHTIVLNGRGARIKDMSDIKKAGIYFGNEGVKVGLVDQVMSRDEAINKAKELSGSKVIFTRDELKKMSKQADASNSYMTAVPAPVQMAPNLYTKDIAFAIETLREIKAGETFSVEYRMPYKF